MKKPIVFMFSGQGSQYYHMGKELYENNARFKLWMDYCDEIVHPLIDTSLIDILYQEQVSKSDPFDQILYTNPALLCIEYSLARLLMEMEVQPDYLLGYSLGELTASVISNALSLEQGIEFAVALARLLENETPPAGMLAIISSHELMATYPDIFQNCWLAGRNFQGNFVVSGLAERVHSLQGALKQKEIVSQKLPVNYGFHTELMGPLETKFRQLVQRMNLCSIGTPIISSLRAEKIQKLSDDYFWDLIRYPVEFEKTVTLMLGQGDYIFIDVGPSGTLATFIKYLLPANSKSIHLETINPFGRDLNSIEKLKLSLPA